MATKNYQITQLQQDNSLLVLHPQTNADVVQETTNNKVMTAAERTKLAGIEAGAEVNVQADWNAASGDAAILNKPTTLPNPTALTIDEGGTTKTYDGTAAVSITIPSTSGFAAKTEAVGSFVLSINSSTYVISLQAKDVNGDNLGTAQTIDLPLESVVVSGSYDDTTKKIILTLQNGSTVEFSVADLVSGLQTEITAQNPLSADLVADGTTNKAYTATEKTKLAGIAAGAEVNVQADWNTSDSSADSFIKNKPTTLKNPYSLSIDEGGTSKTYDGSAAVSITIPSYTVDSALSGTSENPVQNKVVKAALDNKLEGNNITAGTFSVVSVDADGLVTAGAQLIEVGATSQTTPSASLAVGGIFFKEL